MRCSSHKGLLCWFLVVSLTSLERAGAADPGETSELLRVNSQLLEISYVVPEQALPLQRVDLYVSSDRSDTWQKYGSDPDARSPMRLELPADGVYGLFFVLRNEIGYSSGPPQPGQSAQRWIQVDTASPLIQIRQLSVVQNDNGKGQRIVLSWVAHDDNLSERPVSLYYQVQEQPGWKALATSIANVGRYDGLLPEGLYGSLEVRIEVIDQAHNLSRALSSAVVVDTRLPELEQAAAQKLPADDTAEKEADAELDQPIPTDPQKARKLLELGVFYKQRGDFAVAAERLIEALRYDPSMAEPRHELAEIYLAEGDYEGALDIQHTILDMRPGDLRALRGCALAAVAMKRYPEALQFLDQVLSTAPQDAQAWMDAGDVLVRLGSAEQAARYWKESIRLSPADSRMRGRAELRLKKFVKKD